jgi:hypothetical protein
MAMLSGLSGAAQSAMSSSSSRRLVVGVIDMTKLLLLFTKLLLFNKTRLLDSIPFLQISMRFSPLKHLLF